MSPVPTYHIEIDWENNGSWVDAGDDVTSRVRHRPGLTTRRGRDQLRQIAPPAAGRASWELDNRSRDYSTENSGSALYDYLIPGRPVRIRATYDGDTYPIWQGILDDLPQHPERRRRTVSIPCLGNLTRLVGKRISTALYQKVRIDEVLEVILDAVGWPSGERVLDEGRTILEWWWADDEDAFQAVRALLDCEGPGAAIYEDGQGRFVFESRHYRYLSTRSTVSQATIRDAGVEPLFSEPFSYSRGLKDIANTASLELRIREASTLGEVWQHGEVVSLGADEVREIVARGTEPFIDAVTPAVGPDYQVPIGSIVDVSLDRDSGQSCTITLTAGSAGASVRNLRLRAYPVEVISTITVKPTVNTSASIARFGIQELKQWGPRSEIDPLVVQDLVNATVALYQEPRPTVSINLKNATDERLVQALEREVSDRITIVEAQTGLDTDCWIEQIAVQAGGNVHQTTFGCEVASTVSYGIWGTSEWGEGDVWGF